MSAAASILGSASAGFAPRASCVSTGHARWAVALLAGLLSALLTLSASAENSRAQELFDQAAALMAKHDYELACYKLSESQELDPQLGTLLHLAHCLEAAGRWVDAYSSFEAAVKLAMRRNEAGNHEPREAIARKRADALRAKLCLVSLQFDDAAQPQLQLELDGQPLDVLSWARAIAVTPGHHVLRAKAATAVARDTPFDVAAEQRSLELHVPKLAPRPDLSRLDVDLDFDLAPPSQAPPARASDGQPLDQPSTWLRDSGYVVAGIGAAGLLVGAMLGVMKNAKVTKMREICPVLDACDISHRADVTALYDDARGLAAGANWTFALSGATLAAGLGLALTQLVAANSADTQRTAASQAPRATAF